METEINQAKFVNTQLSEGVLFVDKPTGFSSHFLVNWARKQSGIKKVGHTGTLDPLATGLLILLIGKKYTKLQPHYLKQDKEYICTARLGLQTDSYDVAGETLFESSWTEVAAVTQSDIKKIIPQFIGNIKQAVPIFSAVKKDGKKLYKLACKAQYDVGAQAKVTKLLKNLPQRSITIYSLDLLEFKKNEAKKEVTFSFRVFCSSGTYVRSIAHDIGKILGVGAIVTELKRTKIGNFSVREAVVCPHFCKKFYRY